MATAADYRSKSDEDLDKELGALRREQFNLRMQKATGQLSNSARLGQVRREIARIKTVKNQAAMKTNSTESST